MAVDLGGKSSKNIRKIDRIRHRILNSTLFKVAETYCDMSWYGVFRDFDVKQLALY